MLNYIFIRIEVFFPFIYKSLLDCIEIASELYRVNGSLMEKSGDKNSTIERASLSVVIANHFSVDVLAFIFCIILRTKREYVWGERIVSSRHIHEI